MDPLEQLGWLSEQILNEEASPVIERIAESLRLGEACVNPSDARLEAEGEKYIKLLLRSMRIHLCLELIGKGHKFCRNTFRQDWAEVIGSLQVLENSWNVTGELLADALDVVLLLEPRRKDALLQQLSFGERMKLQSQKNRPLRENVVECALRMADYCLDTYREAELYRIVQNLIALSEARTTGVREDHRAAVAEALAYVVDNDRELSLRICEAQYRYFENSVDAASCIFHWFYGCCLIGMQRQDEAYQVLKRCYRLHIEVEGERSWIAVRANAACCWHELSAGRSDQAEAYLWDMLKKIDAGFYVNMDDSLELVAEHSRAVLLKIRMDRQEMQGLLPELERLRAYCESVKETCENPFLTIRNAENLLAGYYLGTGAYLRAAEHSLNALHAIPPNGLPKDPSDVLIYSNLLLIYTSLNDADMMIHYANKLVELAPEYENDDAVLSRVSVLVGNAQRKLSFGNDDFADEIDTIMEVHRMIFCEGGLQTGSIRENVGYAAWVFDACSGILDFHAATEEQLVCMREVINYFRERPELYPFNDVQKSLCYLLLTQVECRLKSPDAPYFLEKCLSYAEGIDESREGRIAILRLAAVVYYIYGKPDQARACTEGLMRCVTSAWQKATAYLNDQRVCQVLTYIQHHYKLSHAVLRMMADSEELYERVLQFKDLPALVGRERNRLLRLAPVDEELRDRIFELQDRIADAELNDSLKGTDSVGEIAARLEPLEASFAAKFPQNLQFTQISFDRLCRKLPENAAILEYYFVLGESAITSEFYDEDHLELDIFVTAKRGSTANLDHIRVTDAGSIIRMSGEFVAILQNPDDLSASGRKATLRGALYRELIAPALPYLEGITDLYIAPDDVLCSLPFEILYGEGSRMLQDVFRVCRLSCGRDLLFYDETGPGNAGCFILGDPNYESDRGEWDTSRNRGGRTSLTPVDALPFSGIEAERISRRCHARAYTGDDATKYALQDALPRSVIHLATHGVYDEEQLSDSLYASHLVFAGYNRWVTSMTESSSCGNGVLTADEISRMDLKQTELVVLSACQSGLGDTSYGSVRGLVSAFAAAGARWTVSHLWTASDFATPILMDAFYDAYLNQSRNVPEALIYAKNYLKTVTIGMLRQNGWLELPVERRFSEEIQEEMNDLREWPDDATPFEDEYFWGGFTVHKSR